MEKPANGYWQSWTVEDADICDAGKKKFFIAHARAAIDWDRNNWKFFVCCEDATLTEIFVNCNGTKESSCANILPALTSLPFRLFQYVSSLGTIGVALD
ncbi:hypothetical protein [Paraburkholderia sp. 35.1]|uniref:hypothetical protein n=1 Tax=Paraburkholderia sp. 35.1 TaxID=2991058 RepID=UPI003D256CB6